MRFVVACLLAAGVAVAVASPSWAAPAPKEEAKSDKAGTTPEKIRQALDKTGTFDFQNNNLSGVLTTIGEQYKIQITLDKMVLMQSGFDTDSLNVQFTKKDVKLRTAIQSIISEYNLTMTVLSDCLLITTEEMAVYRQLKQRVSMDYEEVPLAKAMKDISNRYGVSIVIDPKAIKSKAAESKVSLQVDDVPVEAAVRLLCEMADLKPARMGNVILITTEARADKLKDSNSLVPAPTNPAMPGGIFPFPGGVPGFGGGVGGVQIAPAVAVPALPEPAEKPAEKKELDPPADKKEVKKER